MDSRVAEIEEFLAAHGAGEIAHPGGTLLAHLRRTHDTLAGWGARTALRLAGLAHAAYGTDGFPNGLIPVGERPVLADLIGTEAEEIVYTYASAARGSTYAAFCRGEEPEFHDRFTGASTWQEPRLVRDFVELTFANELDVLAHDEHLLAQHGDVLRQLFFACRPYASQNAHSASTRFFGARRPSRGAVNGCLTDPVGDASASRESERSRGRW
jgi:hypothetical protein